MRQRNIEVIVSSRLFSEYGINRPSAIDVNLQAVLFQKRNEVGGVVLKHTCSVAAGYFNNPEATRATVDEDGWLHTGDIARVDGDGNFYIVDRLKELIKYKGMQVAPAELESVLIAHPSVSDAAVIPIPDEEAGEIPKAFVVTREPIAAEDLMAFVATRVAPHKKVRRVEFVEQIPKSPSGKILRRVLRDRERARAGV